MSDRYHSITLTLERDIQGESAETLPAGWLGRIQAKAGFVGFAPLWVADIGAGYGCWSSVLRQLAQAMGFPVHITGVELDGRKRPHLEKWCDEVRVGDWREFALERGGRFDLCMGNPPFKQLLADGETPMHEELLGVSNAVLLLHHLGAFMRRDANRAAWRRAPAQRQWWLPPIGFRGDGKTDMRSYCASLWRRGHDGPTSFQLLGDPAGGASWQWTKLPGTESPEDADALGLPLAPGYERGAR